MNLNTEPAERAEESSGDLVRAIGAGNRRAEQVLVERYWRGLHGILTRQSDDPDLAADLAQETLLLAITRAREERIENPDAIAAYLRQVAVNMLIDYRRKEKRRSTDTNSDILLQVPTEQRSLVEQVDECQRLAFVRRLVQELAMPRDRELLHRVYFQHQEKPEICTELGLSSVHYDRVIHRARERLKQLIRNKFDVADSSLPSVVFFVLTALAPTTDGSVSGSVGEMGGTCHYYSSGPGINRAAEKNTPWG